jgi:multiple sugar transport system ATP-binding protein
MRTEIKKLHQRLKATIVYVTHDQIEAMTLATRIAVMKGGVVQQLGTPYEVYNRPANTFVAGFMGSPRMNLVQARLNEHPGGGLALEFQQGAGAKVLLDLPAEVVPAALAGYAGQDVIAGLRPEAVSLAKADTVAGPLQCFVQADIEVIEPTGADTLVVIDLGGHGFTARLEPNLPIAPGQHARFLVDLSKLVCFDAKTEALIG